jgi:predicted dehydrogenase
MKIYRAGIIGCGMIASGFADDPKMMGDIFTHAEAYSHCDRTVLAAICDTDPVQLAKCGQRWDVNAQYTDLKEMVRQEKLDTLSVCTPDETHYQVILDVLSENQSVKAILCEKPLATSVEAAQEILALARQENVLLAVMYMRRYAQNYRALKAFLSSGKLGQIQAVTGWYTKGVRHNGTHWFDALRYLVGEVHWVRAWNRVEDNLLDPTLDVVLGLESGCIASLRACDPAYFTVFEMEIMGSLGRVHILDSGFQIEYSRVMDSKRYSGYKELEIFPLSFGDRKDLTLHAVEDMAASLDTGEAVACTAEDGLLAIKIAESAVESAERNAVVQLI